MFRHLLKRIQRHSFVLVNNLHKADTNSLVDILYHNSEYLMVIILQVSIFSYKIAEYMDHYCLGIIQTKDMMHMVVRVAEMTKYKLIIQTK